MIRPIHHAAPGIPFRALLHLASLSATHLLLLLAFTPCFARPSSAAWLDVLARGSPSLDDTHNVIILSDSLADQV